MSILASRPECLFQLLAGYTSPIDKFLDQFKLSQTSGDFDIHDLCTAFNKSLNRLGILKTKREPQRLTISL